MCHGTRRVVLCTLPRPDQIIGADQTFTGPYGERPVVYADWTASGRLYAPIERVLHEQIGPFVGNTHSESSVTGATMTAAYHHAQQIIKQHVHAAPDDVLITAGAGMTTVVNKLQRLLGLRLPDALKSACAIPSAARPLVVVSHMEHHSNHTSWLETIADVECLPPDAQGLVSGDALRAVLARYADRALKIGAFTACSNVTGIQTPYHELARIMHEHGGVCFVDFAASAPYGAIDMHPPDPLASLDAIYFSPHKFLGGPGSTGVLVFNPALYRSTVPDRVGGGTVAWTNPWKEHRFLPNIEAREDGGTPAFLQTIKAALAIRLKESMGVAAMQEQEASLLEDMWAGLRLIPGLHILAEQIAERLGIISFYVEGLHYNLLVKLLNDRFGIQTRGGCSCAGTYGHYLLHVDQERSHRIAAGIDRGDLSDKPGWVRVSLHPTMTTAEVQYILGAIDDTVRHHEHWAEDYHYVPATNEWQHHAANSVEWPNVSRWFALG